MDAPAEQRLSAARAAVAAAYLDALPDARVGGIVLRDDQRRIVARAARALQRDGGCLVAEDVGRGKTFIALALARRWARPLVVAPAALRATWRSACDQAATPCSFISHEALSRGVARAADFDGIIVDESHHYRTVTTRRHAALAQLAARTPVILLTATPLQNRTRDLAAQLSLFLGERAFALEPGELARLVIRGAEADVPHMPHVMTPEWVTIETDDAHVLQAILDLAAPATPVDGGDAGALRTIGLVRAWASSRAALRSRIRSRARLAAALEQGVEEGRAPTRREARAWTGAADSVQLGFPLLLMDATPSAPELLAMRSSLANERCAMQRLIDILGCSPDPDLARIEALRRLRTLHGGSRLIAFSEFASTVAGFFAVLRREPGVGMLTAREARIATGVISRDEMLARCAPRAQHARVMAAHESVTLLLATDLISEGVNLQDANIVIHLDLPWNPARLAQRVGRVRRPGEWTEVRSYVLAPPASAEALLDVDARLRRKLATADCIVGESFTVLPTGALIRAPVDNSSSADGALVARFGRWSNTYRPPEAKPVLAAVCAEEAGWFAAFDDGRVVASLGDTVTTELPALVRASALLEGAATQGDESQYAAALRAVECWTIQADVLSACGVETTPGPLRLAIGRWLAGLSIQSPRHNRAALLPLIGRVRAGARATLPLGTERRLAAHIAEHRSPADARAALETAVEIMESARPGCMREPPALRASRLVALIVLRSVSS